MEWLVQRDGELGDVIFNPVKSVISILTCCPSILNSKVSCISECMGSL